MTDPKRWSEDGETADVTRELLLVGQTQRMPDAERRAVWAGLALTLPLSPTVPGADAAAPVAAFSAIGAYFTKGLIFLAALGGLGAGALQFWSPDDSAPKAAVLLPAPGAVDAPAPLAAPEPAAAAVAVVAPAAAPAIDAKPRAASASQLREESMAVLEARAALRSGDAARSLALLEQARQRFPRGALGQEREALTIEALSRSGQTAVARRRAETFLRVYPKSPHVADVRRIAER